MHLDLLSVHLSLVQLGNTFRRSEPREEFGRDDLGREFLERVQGGRGEDEGSNRH